MSSPRRVALLAPRLVPHDSRLLKQQASLRAAGFQVAAFAPDPGPGAPFMDGAERMVSPGEFPFMKMAPPMARARARAWRDIRAAATRLAAYAPDVLIASEPESLAAAIRLKRRTGVRLVYDAHEFHEDEEPDQEARNRWVRDAHSRAARWLDGFVTVNHGLARLYAEAQPGFPQAVVVTNAAHRAPRPPRYDGRLHAAAGLEPSTPILLYHGALRTERGLESLAHAADLLPQPWRTVFLGDGALRERLAAIMGGRGLILPPVPSERLGSTIVGASIGVLLYRGSTLNQAYCTPNKLWECASAGVPLLSTPLPELMRVTAATPFLAFVAEPVTPPAIAAAVTAASPDWLAVARAAARTFAERNTWEEEAAKLIALVDRLSRGPATP